MKPKDFDRLFEELDFDIREPAYEHRKKFLSKLNEDCRKSESKNTLRYLWLSVSGVAALLIVSFFAFSQIMQSTNENNSELASVSPEMKQTQEFYTGLINQELNTLKQYRTPETEAIIQDALRQMEKLELNYKHLQEDLVESGKDNRVIHAMIQNFQQRIDLLNSVLTQIEEIKSLKNQDHEGNII